MENDITLCFIKYLLENDIIDINYLKNLESSKFLGSNLHKLVAHLSVNCINIKSEIYNKELYKLVKKHRNLLVHNEGSIKIKNLKISILSILKAINKLVKVDTYSEYDYMIYDIKGRH